MNPFPSRLPRSALSTLLCSLPSRVSETCLLLCEQVDVTRLARQVVPRREGAGGRRRLGAVVTELKASLSYCFQGLGGRGSLLSGE